MSQSKITMKPIMLDITGVAEITGMSESTVQNLVRKNDFPKPRKTSGRGARWLVREIEEWAEARPISDILPPPNTAEGGRNSKRNRAEQTDHATA